MATVAELLTLQEFRERYSDLDKPYYEFWFGEAVRKTVPTWLHAVLQGILCEFLARAGYKTGSELELRIDPEWQPKADVVASASSIPGPYPEKPVDIVAEVLSPLDPMARVYAKCRQYQRIGIPTIFVLDPHDQNGWQWSAETDNLERISQMDLPNGSRIPLQTLWDELDRRR